MRRALNPVDLAEQLPNRDLRFARITLPLCDRVRHRIVESKQALLHSRERCNSPKAFCPAKDRPSPVRRPAVCIMLKNCPAILHYQYRTAAPALGVFCGTRAIGRLDVRERNGRFCKKKPNEHLTCSADSENHVAFVLSPYDDTTRARCGGLGSTRLWRVGFGVAPKQALPDTLRFDGSAPKSKFAIARTRSPARQRRALPRLNSAQQGYSGVGVAVDAGDSAGAATGK